VHNEWPMFSKKKTNVKAKLMGVVIKLKLIRLALVWFIWIKIQVMHYLKPKIHANHDHIYAKSVKKGNNIIYKVHEGPFLWFSWLFRVAIIRSYTSSSSSSSTTSSSRRQNDKVGSFNFRMNIDDALATFHHMIHLHPLPFVVEFN
jgi:hypothetical protein